MPSITTIKTYGNISVPNFGLVTAEPIVMCLTISEHCNDSANREQNKMSELIFYAEMQPIFALAKVFDNADSIKQLKTF